jgi:hypothetical protein
MTIRLRGLLGSCINIMVCLAFDALIPLVEMNFAVVTNTSIRVAVHPPNRQNGHWNLVITIYSE